MEAVVQVVLQRMWFDTTNSCKKYNENYNSTYLFSV